MNWKCFVSKINVAILLCILLSSNSIAAGFNVGTDWTNTIKNLHTTGTGTFDGGVVGNITGNVTGNITGNLTGNVTGNLTGDVTGNVVNKVNTIATLRATTPVNGKYIQVLGYTTVGDGGGGPVRYGVTGAAPGTYVDNGGSIIVPTGGNGSTAWLWSWSGPYNVQWFGATSGGDLASYVQKTIDALPITGGEVLIGVPGWVETGVHITINNITITGNYSALKYKMPFTGVTYGAEVTLNMFTTTAHNTNFRGLWLQGGEPTKAALTALGIINNFCMIQFYTSAENGSVKDCVFYNDFTGGAGFNGPSILVRNGVPGVEIAGNDFINDDTGTNTEIGAGGAVTHGNFTNIHNNFFYNLRDSNASIDSGRFNTIQDNVFVNEKIVAGKVRAVGDIIEVGSAAQNWSILNNTIKGSNGPAIIGVEITPGDTSFNGIISGNNIAIGYTAAEYATPVDTFYGIALSTNFYDTIISNNRIEVPQGSSSYGISAYSHELLLDGNHIRIRGGDTSIAAGIYLNPGTATTSIKNNIISSGANYCLKLLPTPDDYAGHPIIIRNNDFLSGDVGVGAGGATVNAPVNLSGNYFATAVVDKLLNLTTPNWIGTDLPEWGTMTNSATPTVTGYKYMYTGGTTKITDLLAGIPGQELTIFALHNITIDGAGTGTSPTYIFLNGGVDFAMTPADVLRLVRQPSGWRELSRSDYP